MTHKPIAGENRTAFSPAAVVQKKCAGCEKEEKENLRMKPVSEKIPAVEEEAGVKNTVQMDSFLQKQGGGTPPAPSVPDPDITSWVVRNGDGSSTLQDNCCASCPVTLGVDCDSPNFRNGIEFKAVVSNHRAGFTYDIKRTKHTKSWRRNGSGSAWSIIPAGSSPEGTPDDSRNSDECLTPIVSGSNHHIYSEDRPGLRNSVASGNYTDYVRALNFIEFVRITRPDRTTYDDSTVKNWHSKTWVTKTGGTWANDDARSSIASGHLANLNP